MRVEKKSSDSRQKELEKELEWINASPKARQAKSKARVSNYENLLEEAAKEERRDQVSQLYVRICISVQVLDSLTFCLHLLQFIYGHCTKWLEYCAYTHT
jgi:hypothetical protein